jgi:hypothetical protein
MMDVLEMKNEDARWDEYRFLLAVWGIFF